MHVKVELSVELHLANVAAVRTFVRVNRAVNLQGGPIRLGYGDLASLTEWNTKIRYVIIDWNKNTKYLNGFTTSELLSSGGSNFPTGGTFLFLKINLGDLKVLQFISFHLHYVKLYSNNGHWNEICKKAFCMLRSILVPKNCWSNVCRLTNNDFGMWTRWVFFQFYIKVIHNILYFFSFDGKMEKLLFFLVAVQSKLRTWCL